MDNLEKILFIDLTCHQVGVPNGNHPDFFATWEKLSVNEKAQYAKLTNEIHQIWNFINMPTNIKVVKRVSSVFEYNESIHTVSARIFTVCKDFEISLKREMTEEFKTIVKRILGKDYFNWLNS